MSEHDQEGRAVHDAERARLDEGLCALGFPSGGGRRGGGFRLKAAVREARTDRAFDFGEEWQRNRETEAADGAAAAGQPPRRLAPPAKAEARLLSFAPRPPAAASAPDEQAAAASTARAAPSALDDGGIANLLGYLERRDERIFGLIERLALGGPPALPAPAAQPQVDPAAQPQVDAAAQPQVDPAAQAATRSDEAPAAGHAPGTDPEGLADRLGRIEAALAALLPTATANEQADAAPADGEPETAMPAAPAPPAANTPASAREAMAGGAD